MLSSPSLITCLNSGLDADFPWGNHNEWQRSYQVQARWGPLVKTEMEMYFFCDSLRQVFI